MMASHWSRGLSIFFKGDNLTILIFECPSHGPLWNSDSTWVVGAWGGVPAFWECPPHTPLWNSDSTWVVDVWGGMPAFWEYPPHTPLWNSDSTWVIDAWVECQHFGNTHPIDPHGTLILPRSRCLGWSVGILGMPTPYIYGTLILPGSNCLGWSASILELPKNGGFGNKNGQNY